MNGWLRCDMETLVGTSVTREIKQQEDAIQSEEPSWQNLMNQFFYAMTV